MVPAAATRNLLPRNDIITSINQDVLSYILYTGVHDSL